MWKRNSLTHSWWRYLKIKVNEWWDEIFLGQTREWYQCAINRSGSQWGDVQFSSIRWKIAEDQVLLSGCDFGWWPSPDQIFIKCYSFPKKLWAFTRLSSKNSLGGHGRGPLLQVFSFIKDKLQDGVFLAKNFPWRRRSLRLSRWSMAFRQTRR